MVCRIMDEYAEERKHLEQRYKAKLRDLCVPYAQSRARYKVGDILERSGIIIRVERIGATISRDEILTAYSGPMLTKSFKTGKDNPVNGFKIVDHNDNSITKL